MRKVYLLILIVVVLFVTSFQSIAQDMPATDSTEDIPIEISSYGVVSAGYNSDVVFLGRKSAAKAPYLFATAGYYHKSGLSVNAYVSYLVASGENRIDLFAPSVGYEFNSNNLIAGISATAYFFNSKSYTTKSALTGSLNAYADYNAGIVEVYVDGTVYGSHATDFVVDAGVGHSFYAVGNNLKITPSVYLNAGTQNYYSSYSNNSRFGRHMNSSGSGSMFMGAGMMGGWSFTMLDYEWCVPVSFTRNHFEFSFFPVYAMPVNAATIVNDQETYKEDLSNSFYWTLSVSYKFF